MIRIRSTEKLATSNSQGLCDVLREMSNFTFDIERMQVKVNVQDFLFQEKEIKILEGDEEKIWIERKLIETKLGENINYPIYKINHFFKNLGKVIDPKGDDFSTSLLENLAIVLIAETTDAKRQTMSNWIPDTEHVLVTEFTQQD